jgi:predicted DNA-binding transcriptional regulator AlpA
MDVTVLQAELDRLGARLARPRPVRARNGQWRRNPGAEWDWYYALPESERRYIHAHYMVDKGLGPDEIADQLGLTIDEAMDYWLDTVRTHRNRYMARLDPLSDEWSLEECGADDHTMDTLLGPDECAELLGVMRNTIAQWRHRNTLPTPTMTLSGLPIWQRQTILDWANDTGRLLDSA